MGRKRRTRKDLPEKVYFRHGAYYLVDRAGRWVRLHREYSRAMQHYGEMRENTGFHGSIASLMDRYMVSVAPKKARSTYLNNLKEMKPLRAVFGSMRPEDVRPRDIYAYLDKRPLVAGNREKALLSHLFNCAIEWGAAEDNPCRQVRRNRQNQERPRTRYVEDWEYRLVWKLAAPILRCAMDLSYITGMRQGDLLRIRLRDLTEEGIFVQEGKTGKRTIYEWTPELRVLVEQLRKLREIGSLYLICTRAGQRYTSDGFRSLWQRLMRKALEEGLQERFTFHDLRAKTGSDADKPVELLGHDDARTTNRVYRRKPRKVRPLR